MHSVYVLTDIAGAHYWTRRGMFRPVPYGIDGEPGIVRFDTKAQAALVIRKLRKRDCHLKALAIPVSIPLPARSA